MNYQTQTQRSRYKTAHYRSLLRVALPLLLATATGDVLLVTSARAAEAQTSAVITGRVLNAESGRYLSRARITVQETNEETYTNDFGEYTLYDVKPGVITLKVMYSGLEPLTTTLTVKEGENVKKDFSFGSEVTALNEFLVETNRFHNAQEIATNEEKTSVTLKNVIAADAFGKVANGNIGEFVKFLPGIQVDYGTAGNGSNAALASSISVRGFGPDQTNIMINGRTVADPSSAGMTRSIGLDMLSINNASRVEVIKVATPDMPSTSPGGAINLIPLSAFEYAKPEITLGVQATMNTKDTKVFSKEGGPANKNTYHTLPGGDLRIVYPFSNKLGVSFTVSSYNDYTPNYLSAFTYGYAPVNLNQTPIGGPNGALVNSLGQISGGDHPVLNRAQLTSSPWDNFRVSSSLSVDWKPIPSITINAGFTYSTYNGVNASRRMDFRIPDYSDFGPDFVTGFQSQTARGLTINYPVAQTVTSADREGSTSNFVLTGKWDHGPWHLNSGISRAVGRGKSLSVENGHFSEFDLNYTAGSVSVFGIKDGVPGSIVVKDQAGNPFDYTKVTSYNGTNSSAKVGSAASRDTVSIYNVDLRRDLDFLPIDMSLKIGVYRKDNEKSKWGVGTGFAYDYTGPALTLTDYLDTINTGAPFSNQPPQQWGDVYKFYSIFKAHPDYFTQSLGTQIGNYNTIVNQYKSLVERNDNYYAMIDGTFFRSRLSYVMGVRAGHNSDNGFGPFRDGNWMYVENPDGSRYRDAAHPQGYNLTQAATFADAASLAALRAKGLDVPTSVLGLANADLVSAKRNNKAAYPIHGNQTQPLTPTVAASYKITDALIFKLSWSRETLLPSIENTPGSGSLLTSSGQYTVTDALTPSGGPGGDGTITVANPNLKPQQTDSYNATLSYYTKNGGKFEGSYYYKKIKNQWETDGLVSGDDAFEETLASLGLSTTTFQNYTISTTINGLTNATNKGYELSFQQNLGLFADFGKYFDIFGTFSHKTYQASSKPGVISLTATASDLATGGIRFAFKRLSMSLRGTHRNAIFGGNPNGTTFTFNGVRYAVNRWTPAELKLDAEAHYQVTKHLDVYLSAANVTNSEKDQKGYDVANIIPEYARTVSVSEFGTQIVGGLSYKF